MAGRARLQKIVEQARATFGMSNPSKDPLYKENLEKLKEAMNAVSAEDFNISPAVADKEWVYQAGPDFYKANAACMEVGQCKDFSVAIFLLKAGCGLPLHDHPGMHGCMKVLFGEIEVTSYSTDFDESKAIKTYNSWRGPLVYPCEILSTKCITPDDDPITLEPGIGNIHEIQSKPNVPVAFLDILAPPYDPDSGRDCTYYYKCNIGSEDGKNNSSNIVYLRPGSSPPGFLCIPQTYPGPKVNV